LGLLGRFVQSEKDTRPYAETLQRGALVPLGINGFTGKAELAVPSLIAGPTLAAQAYFDDPIREGELPSNRTDAVLNAIKAATGAQGAGGMFFRPLGSLGMAGRPRTIEWNDARIKQLMQMREEGRPDRTIADALGISRPAVHRAAARFGAVTRPIGRPSVADQVEPHRLSALRAMYENGTMSQTEIGNYLGITQGAVSQLLKRIKDGGNQ
jgi:DNA-binding CsgD family transcriptional regulator